MARNSSQKAIHDRGNLRLVGVANHPRDAPKSGELFWRALGITAGYDDASRRIFRVKFADGIASLGIRRSRDRAGVYHYDVRIPELIGRREAALEQLPFDSGTIGLRCPTTKLFNVKSPHEAILSA
jgi:hypothetical protein